MSELTSTSTVVAVEHQTSALVQGERVILDLKRGGYYGLDPVGAYIWELIEQPTTVEKVIDAVMAEYAVSRERCTEDVIGVLAELEQHGLIKRLRAVGE